MNEWKPIETAPKDGTRVLVLHEEGFAVVAFKRRTAWRVTWRFEKLHGRPTHWMPIPDPPGGESC